MSMPESWVDELWARLTLRYGASFLRQYAELDLKAVKADWAQVLSGFNRAAIRYGLDHLPADKAPNALQFRAICNAGPRDDGYLRLPAPTVDRESPDMQRVREKLAGLRKKLTGFATRQEEQLAQAEQSALADPRTEAA